MARWIIKWFRLHRQDIKEIVESWGYRHDGKLMSAIKRQALARSIIWIQYPTTQWENGARATMEDQALVEALWHQILDNRIEDEDALEEYVRHFYDRAATYGWVEDISSTGSIRA